MARRLSVLQLLPALQSGGVERGTVEVAAELTRRGHRAVVMSGGGRMVAELEEAGAEHIAWEIGRKSPLTLRLVPRLRRLLREQDVDILHARSRLPAWVAYLAWRGMDPRTRPRLVTTVHGFYSVGRYSAVMTKGERVIAVSESVRGYILENYRDVDAGRVHVIHRGVDRARYPYGFTPDAAWAQAWAREYPQTRGRFIVTLPARLTRLKGQLDFVDVIGGLSARGVPVHGLIVGGFDERRRPYVEELQRAIAGAGLGARITVTGHRSDLREIMASSDVVLSLSRNPEAFGRTTIEALSLGTPVCGYDHGGVAEQLSIVLPQGLVPVGDRARAIEHLAAWYRSPPLVPPEHPFTLTKMLEATLRLYTEAARAERA